MATPWSREDRQPALSRYEERPQCKRCKTSLRYVVDQTRSRKWWKKCLMCREKETTAQRKRRKDTAVHRSTGLKNLSQVLELKTTAPRPLNTFGSLEASRYGMAGTTMSSNSLPSTNNPWAATSRVEPAGLRFKSPDLATYDLWDLISYSENDRMFRVRRVILLEYFPNSVYVYACTRGLRRVSSCVANAAAGSQNMGTARMPRK